MTTSRRTKRKSKTRRKFLYTLLIVSMLMLSGVIVFAINLSLETRTATNKMFQPLERDVKKENKVNEKFENAKAEDSPFTILIGGIDNQEKAKYGRSDVLMIATVNPKTGKTSMLSIPRDTRLYISKLGYKDKINHAYANGGINYIVPTVEELLDIEIDYYVTTDFKGFEDIVDTVGGVDVEVPFTFKAQLTESLKWKTYTKGPMTLTGNEALAYVRMRKKDPLGDAGRNIRQKDVIKAVIDKAAGFGSITKLDDMIKDVGNNVKTNIPSSEYFGLIKMYQKIKDTPIEQLELKGYDDRINGVSYFILNKDSLEEVKKQLQLNLDGFGQNAQSDLNTSKTMKDLTIGE